MKVNFFGTMKQSLLFMLISIYLICGNSLVIAQSQEVCTKQLAQAENDYNRGRFDEAINMITECLGKSGMTEQERMRAYRLLGLAYLAKDYLEDARSAVRKLLDMVPNYESDPVQDPPPFTKLIEEVKQEQPEKTEKKMAEEQKQKDEILVSPKLTEEVEAERAGGSKKWYFIGGGIVVAGGVVAALLLSGNGNGNDIREASFPMPPGRP